MNYCFITLMVPWLVLHQLLINNGLHGLVSLDFKLKAFFKGLIIVMLILCAENPIKNLLLLAMMIKQYEFFGIPVTSKNKFSKYFTVIVPM
jgi:hypothetical protein